jgi:hypothetical protein
VIKLTRDKIEEITQRHANKTEWDTKEPFFKGMFWTDAGGKIKSDEYVAEWTHKTKRPNLLVIGLPGGLLRSDFINAKMKYGELSSDIAMLEAALDESSFVFADEKDFFGEETNKDTVDLNSVHKRFLKNFLPTSDRPLAEIAKVAQRLRAAANRKIPGVVLAMKRWHQYSDHYALTATDTGYTFADKQREVVLEETETYIRTQSQRLDIAQTPSLYSQFLKSLIDPLFAHAKSQRDYSQEPGILTACIIADMIAHGETSVIVELHDGKEFVLANLHTSISIREISTLIRGVIDNCFQIEIVRVLPPPRPRHRFYIVGNTIVADSCYSTDLSTSGHASVMEYVKENGPAKTIISTRKDDDDIRVMRSFCEGNLTHICHYRANWIIDIELENGVPYLAGIEEIFDGQWFGDVEENIMIALEGQQRSAFSPDELNLSGYGSCYSPKSRKPKTEDDLPTDEETVETDSGPVSDFLASLINDEDEE